MAAPALRAVGSTASGTGDVVTNLPAGVQEDDILILAVETATESVSTPSGWSIVTESPQTLTGNSSKLSVFWKRATTSESAPTITDPGDHAHTVIFAFSGCKTSGNPWNTTAGNTYSGSADPTWPAVTTTVDDCYVLNIGTNYLDGTTAQILNWANASLVSITELVDVATSVGNGGAIFAAGGVKTTAGAVSGTTANAVLHSGFTYLTIALSPPTNQDVTKSTSGFVAFSGAAPNKKVAVKTAAGLLAFSETAPVAKSHTSVSTGSIAFSGEVNRITAKATDGSVSFSGTTVASFEGVNQVNRPTSGEVSFSGAATYGKRLQKDTSGSISFEAAVSLSSVKRIWNSSGSLGLFGSADADLRTPYVAIGGIAFSSLATFHRTKNNTPSGGVIFRGVALITRNKLGASVWEGDPISSIQSTADSSSVWNPTTVSGGTVIGVDTQSVWG